MTYSLGASKLTRYRVRSRSAQNSAGDLGIVNDQSVAPPEYPKYHRLMEMSAANNTDFPLGWMSRQEKVAEKSSSPRGEENRSGIRDSPDSQKSAKLLEAKTWTRALNGIW